MNLRQIETFYWAAKLGSFTAAAERLYATQSTVSTRIQELEHRFNVVLFDRSQRAVRLTPKGRELLAYAEQLLRIAGDMQERISASEALPGIVRLGVVEVVSVTWLPRLIKLLHQRYPNLILELDEALTGDLVERLRNGALDIVLAPGEVSDVNLSNHSLGTVGLAWMASPDLDLPDEPLTPLTLQRWPIISLSRESYHYSRMERWFHAGGANCSRVDTCKSFGVAASLAIAGLGLTLLPPRCFARDLAEGRLRVVPTDPPVPPVPFSAMLPTDTSIPLIRRIANAAVKVSDFDRPRSAETAPY
ncbi:LysR family transcriptional regulator [Azospirillum sp. ST 5-10]|uniref:LysR family transcriptional regulator n=1 Tax=unclassified Azospirillum TaxID=2630922 RepID=UPI003F4A3D40